MRHKRPFVRSAVRLARATLTARPILRAPIEPIVAGSTKSRLVRDRFFQFRGLRAPARSRPCVISVRAADAWLPSPDPGHRHDLLEVLDATAIAPLEGFCGKSMLFTHTRSGWLASLPGEVRFHSPETITPGIATTIAPSSLSVDLTMNEEQKAPDNTPAGASTAELLSVLGNPIRLEILAAIAKAEKSVSDIAQELQLDASTVSHSLSLLSKKHLVQHTPVNKHHFYRLSNAVEASVEGSIVRFVVTTNTGEHLAFETRNP